MNRRAHGLVCEAMAQQRPDPTAERFLERMYSAMRVCIASAPLGATGLVITAVAGLADEAQHAGSIVRLMTMAKLYPDEMSEAVGRLVDLVLADKLPAIREAMARQVKPAGRGRVQGGMTETLQDRLRHGAANIHSIGPARAADLLSEAAKAAADLQEVRSLLEEAIGRTPDPARSAVQVARDAAEHISAARTYRANMENPPADLEAHERAYDALLAWTRAMGISPPAQPPPVVRPEHFAGPFPAISGYVKRTREARAAVVDQALGMLGEGQRLAVHDEPERVDILFLDPGQDPPLGQEWTVYGPLHLSTEARADAAALGIPLVTLRATYVGPLNVPPAPTVEIDHSRSNIEAGHLAFKVRVSPELAAAIERQQEEDAAARLRRTMAEASAEHEGDAATRRMYRSDPAVGNLPAEPLTPEQEAEAAEQAERFQGLDDSDRG